MPKPLAGFRTRVALGVSAGLLAVIAPGAVAGDLIIHNGFEACWSKAITKPQFLDLLQATTDGVTACITTFSGSDSFGDSYSGCNTAACPGNSVGCPITVHTGTFSGDFASGNFSSAGTADDISVPVTVQPVIGPPDNCTVTISNIAFTLAPSYALSADGNSGAYVGALNQPTVMINSFNAVGSDATCQLLALQSGFAQSAAESAAETELAVLLDAATVGESVCPLTP
jgi:hypothetical protein